MQAAFGGFACNFTRLRPLSALAGGGADGMGSVDTGPSDPQTDSVSFRRLE